MSAALQSLMRDETPVERAPATSTRQLLTFIVIGGSGALSFVVLSSLVVWMQTGIAPWMTNAACYGALILPVYLLQRRFSFQSDAAHRRALPRYLAVQGMALLLATVFSYVAYGWLDLPTVLASILVIGLTSGVNFVVLQSWAFARPAALVVASA